ncbi:hypothetical protein EBN03_29230 [Nocardia stercoris]|uniref:Secreted protein n=2 Tax=Nocardia stercoris TaxID=2483361 RepID=A0A3M2KWX0_9NOCA|nr:hypothetical protein EBN03_29230 [Nocardia stercoris]
MWFGLAAVALVGAIVLLYFDRLQRQRTGHVRQVWAKSHGYTYVSVEPSLAATWHRGAMAKLGYLTAVDVVSGIRKGEKFVLFDLEDAATLIAVRRQIGSDIDIDLRLKTAAPPKDADLDLLGAIGDRVVFATNPDIARHAVDQRMVAFIESLPDTVQQLWSEGNWTLGVLPVGTGARDWETAIDAVLRLSGLLHVLPPIGAESRGVEPESGYAEGDFDDDYGNEEDYYEGYGPDGQYEAGEQYEDDEQYERDRYDDRFAGYPESEEPEREADPEPPRRPALAVVPDPRDRREPPARGNGREKRSAAPEYDDHADESDADGEPRGGPFHPGFRPYQGPAR